MSDLSICHFWKSLCIKIKNECYGAALAIGVLDAVSGDAGVVEAVPSVAISTVATGINVAVSVTIGAAGGGALGAGADAPALPHTPASLTIAPLRIFRQYGSLVTSS